MLTDISAPVKIISLPSKERQKELLELFAQLFIEVSDQFIRGDYKELCQISVILLGGQLPGNSAALYGFCSVCFQAGGIL